LIGAYSIGNNTGDVIIMLIFGVIGFLMKKFRYDGAPMVLALVLGPMLEESFRESLMLSHGNFSIPGKCGSAQGAGSDLCGGGFIPLQMITPA
jgi:TctA family transporter